MTIVIYTRQGGHLCDDAIALLRRHGHEPRLVDIDTDLQLRERYNLCVPVIEIDGKDCSGKGERGSAADEGGCTR